MQIQKIVIATDFSPQARPAIDHGLDIARKNGAEIVLIHVCPVAEPPSGFSQPDEWDLYVKNQLAANRDQLEQLRVSLTGQGATVSHMFIDDEPALGVIRGASEIGADLVILGTHGYTGLEYVLLGSVAERVIRGSTVNVLVARPKDVPRGGYRRILAPLDLGSQTEDVLDAARSMVAPDGQIDAHHFWYTPIFGPMPDPELIRTEREASTSQRGASLLSQYQSAEYQLRFSSSEGRPTRETLKLLNSGAYDLVVMGSHGRHGIGRWILGSVAEATARHAPCSVLIVKHHEAKPGLV